jgi:hypothetical protein
MAMGIAVTVVFTGLCALVTGHDGAPGQVLLVDAKGVGMIGGVELPEHAPTLVVSLNSLANPASSNPTRVVMAGSEGSAGPARQVGLWDLTGSEVRIRVQGADETGIHLFRPSDGTSPWPEPPRDINDAAAWRDLRYVADMSSLVGDGRVDPALIDPGRAGVNGLPRALAARIYLEGGRLESGIPSQPGSAGAVFEFRDGAHAPKLRQALTDTIRWSLDRAAEAVAIEIVPVAGGPAKRLVLMPSATPHTLFVSNLPAENLHAHAHRGFTDEEMGALHFGAYYALLGRQPAERPLPRPWLATEPRRSTGGMGGPFCPPARFERN